MANDVVLSVGADTADFKSSIGGLAQDLVGSISSIHPAVGLAVGAIAGIGVAAFNIGKDFDAAFDNIQAGTGATGEALVGLNEDFRATLGNVPDSAADVSTAIADINTKLGLSGEPLQKMSEQFLNLARIPGQENLAGNIDAVSKSFNAWGVEADNQGQTLDFLLKTSQATGVSVADLSAATADAASTGKNLGLSYQETAVLIGGLERAGVDSAGAMGGLKKAVGELTDAGVPAKDALGQIISEIKDAPDATAAGAAAMEIFGKRAGTEMAEQIRAGKFDLDGLMESIQDSPVTVNSAATSIADFGEKFDQLWNKVSLVLEPLGAFLFDGLTAVASFLVDNFNPAMEFMGELWDGLLSFIQPVTDYLRDKVFPALQSVGEVWLGLQLMLRDAFIPVVTAVWNALKPLVSFIADQVVAQIKLFFQNVETLIGWLGKIPGVSDLVKAAQDRVKQAFSDTGAAADTTKGQVDTFTGVVDKAREAQDRVGAPGGSAPKLSAAIRDAGKAHDEAKEKVEKYTDAQNLAVEAANRAYEGELALAGQTAALQTAFDNVEQPVIDVGTAVGGVNDSVLAMSTSMATAGVGPALDKWKTDSEQKLPEVTGLFTQWGKDVKGVTDLLSTDLITGLFTGDMSFGGNIGKHLTTLKDTFLNTFSKPVMDLLTGPDGFVTKGLKFVTDELDKIIGKLTGSGGVKDALGKTFPSSTPGTNAPSPTGVPTSIPGGSTASDVGSAASKMNVASFVMDAVGLGVDIFQSFQFAAMNKSLDILVKHTLQMVNLLGGEGQDSGISLKLKMIEDGVWYGPGVKALEDFRNKWFDFGLPVFRSLELQGAYVQPTLNDISTHGVWAIDRLDSIIRNTERTAVAVERMGSGAGSGLTVNTLQAAVEHNEGGLTTTLNKFVRTR